MSSIASNRKLLYRASLPRKRQRQRETTLKLNAPLIGRARAWQSVTRSLERGKCGSCRPSTASEPEGQEVVDPSSSSLFREMGRALPMAAASSDTNGGGTFPRIAQSPVEYQASVRPSCFRKPLVWVKDYQIYFCNLKALVFLLFREIIV